jgi:hypothetical protein
MDRIKWIDANGKRIMRVDFTGLKTFSEQAALLDEQLNMYKMASTTFFVMSIFTDTAVSNEFMEKMNKAGKEAEIKAAKTAVIGITGVKGILLQGFIRVTGRKTIRACDTEEEAIAYLVS